MRSHLQKFVAMACLGFASLPSSAFFFILPLPNLSKPAPLNTLIDTLETSEETKAVAYVSEDKTFGQKYWVWGHAAGHFPQAEADRRALEACSAQLAKAKAQTAGGKPMYDYGTKACELHSFRNKTVSPRAGEWVAAQAAAQASAAAQAAALAASQSQAAASAAAVVSSAPSNSASASAPVQGSASPQPPTSTTSGPAVESPVAKKLRELDALRKEGLITEAEYQEKRKAVLSSL